MLIPRAFLSHGPVKLLTLGLWSNKTSKFDCAGYTSSPQRFAVVGLVLSNDLENYAGSIIAAGKGSRGRRVEVDGPD